jgi:two-component system phosphate regulon sensor histidine kinase PhoR
MGEVTGRLFEDLMGDVGPDRTLNVVDDDGEVIFGGDLQGAGEFIVVQRFPSTLYKWKVQLAPLSAALFSGQARTQKYSQWMLIPLAFAVIVFGLVVLYMAMVRERRLSRLKSEFIANTSHELKTPLALIRMFAELLSMGRVRDEAKARRYHEIILRETERLTALIDNVLDFAKIERGKSAYEFKLMSLGDVVQPAIEVYRYRTTEAGVDLLFSVREDTPMARIDGDAITLALINLMDNAVKYAKGTDVIGVEIHGDRNNVYLEVYDRGCGIPPHHQKRIFERFYRFQAVGLETRGQRGSGIGLNLVKHIARAHGGSVQVTSTPGVETRFTISIPAARP